jgi:capsular polysaccharide transport system permease protein
MNPTSKENPQAEIEAANVVVPLGPGRQPISAGRGIVRALFRRATAGEAEQAYYPFFRAVAPRVPWWRISFFVCVLIPSIAAIFYLAVLAAPQFTVESRFVVRAADPVMATNEKLSAVASLGAAFTYSSVAQNSYVVAQYIRSRAAVDDLLGLIDLRTIYQRPEADFWARLKSDASEEELVDYWRQMVRAYVDSTSSIVILEVRAFRPDDALKVAQAIITLSERLVNQMSQRARQDVMRFSEEEVRRADLHIQSVLNDLQTARDEEGMLEPTKAADETSRLLMPLMAEKIRIEGDLYVASRSLDKSSPTVRQLKSRLEIAERQISVLKSNLAGDSGASRTVASSLRRFEQLEVQRFLAEKILTFAEDGLERARIKAERQNLYFMVFVSPSLPREAMLPHRLAYSILIPIACLILWGIVALLWATIEDHRM